MFMIGKSVVLVWLILRWLVFLFFLWIWLEFLGYVLIVEFLFDVRILVKRLGSRCLFNLSLS